MDKLTPKELDALQAYVQSRKNDGTTTAAITCESALKLIARVTELESGNNKLEKQAVYWRGYADKQQETIERQDAIIAELREFVEDGWVKITKDTDKDTLFVPMKGTADAIIAKHSAPVCETCHGIFKAGE